jgi:hypothetical protein
VWAGLGTLLQALIKARLHAFNFWMRNPDYLPRSRGLGDRDLGHDDI